MKYLKRFNENMSLAKSIISKKMEGFEKLKDLLSKNIGYIGKFTEYLMNENIPYNELEILYKDLIDLKGKQKTIDISTLNYEGVVDIVQKVKTDLEVNSLISQFPSEQKAFARELAKGNTGYNLLLKASKNDKLEVLISKIKRYHSKDELSTALTLFSKEAMNDKIKIKEYLKDSKSSIVLERNNIMIVKVDNISDVQKLGSDTSWCILTQSQWSNYTSGRYQYILYDFTKDDWDVKFKIGFTLNKDFTVHAAHDILDSGCTSYLNSFMITNEIKYSELIPKVEDIIVTNQMIENIKKATYISILTQYSDNLKLDQIPLFLNKLFTISINSSKEVVVGSTKLEIIKNCLNKYFADKELVTLSDLEKIDPRLPKIIKSLMSRDNKILKLKMVTSKPTFSTRELNPSIIVKMLDEWKEDDLVYEFASDLDFFDIPGKSNWSSITNLEFKSGWNKESVTKISDKLNKIYESGTWEKTNIMNNAYMINTFIRNYVIMNYALGRENIVKKEAISQLNEDTKLIYAYLLKIPIDLYKCKHSTKITKWNIPLIIKKDYANSKIIIDQIIIIYKLVDHLLGYKLSFKISKTNFDRITRQFDNDQETEGKKIILDLINKFKSRKRVGDKVETEDGNISIELF